MSRFVLGSAGFNRIDQSNVDRLICTANDLGIRSIDTAPSYGNSESIIGSSKIIRNWEVFTKLGNPGSKFMNRDEIIKSVDNSLYNLNIDCIHTLFIHSMSMNDVPDEMLAVVEELRTRGKILFTGYSGDGDDLRIALTKNRFDSIMSTLNVLDISNIKILKESRQKNIYLKRILCNGVFQFNPKLEFIDFFFGKHELNDIQNSYRFRFKKMFGHRKLFHNYAKLFLDYLFSLELPAKYLIGTVNTKHLHELIQLESDLKVWPADQLSDYHQNWEKYAEIFSWKPLV